MLGLRQDADQYLQQARNEHGFKKSYRFAERLNGRFFVSGISGGFEKFNKLKHANDSAPAPVKKPKYDYQPVLEKAQREELRREAEKLLELEEKLAEIQRIKEAKRRRDRQRQMRKLQFQSASCIQRFWRKTIRLRREGAANLLVKFLKTQKARQAVYTAAWAASVLKKFAIKASRRWRRWKFFQRQVKRIAAKNWYLVQEVACLWTQARRDVTDQFVHHVIQSAMKNAKRELMAKMGKVRRNSVAVKREPSTYFAFFLTEGSQADSAAHDDDGDGDSEYEDALATDNLSPNAFMRRQQARYLKYLKSQEGQAPPEKKKVYDYNDYRVKILVKKHQDVLKKMDDEEAARLERVERLRKKAQQDAEAQKQEKERQRKEKARQKAALQKKHDEEHQEKLRQFQRQREKRLKLEEQRKKDEKRQEAERKLMRMEDPLVIAKRIRDWQLHVQQLKKAKEAKLLLEQQQQHKRPTDERPLHHDPTPDELAETEERRKAQEAEEARVREALRQRIREKMQTMVQEKKQKEQEEKEKKEKLEQFMGAYQEQLQRQKEEFLKKQREKDRQRKAEEKRLKQAEKAKEQAIIDAILREQEAKDAEERARWQALPESDRRVIASAQDYDDQMPLEDFGFDDFIRKSLTKVYACPPPPLAAGVGSGGAAAAAAAGNNTTTSPTGAAPKWLPTSPEDEHKLQTIKAKVVKTVIKKIPASLRHTPYFKHYFKHTVVNRLLERGLASADDEALLHRQTEELLVQLHKQQAIVSDAEDADATIVAKATAALLTQQPSAKGDVATGGDGGDTTAATAAAAAAIEAIDTSQLAPRGSFAQQPIAPTPAMPAPLSKSRSAGQLVPGPSSNAASSVAVGLRGVKARKQQKEHAFGCGAEPAGVAAASAAAAAAVHDAPAASAAAAATDDDAAVDPEDNEDLMALIARAKQRLLQQPAAPPVKSTVAAPDASAAANVVSASSAMHTSHSQPVLSSVGHETTIELAPKAAATPKPLATPAAAASAAASSASVSTVAMPKMPSVQEFLRMQPGPPSLPGAPPSLDTIASRYPLSWDVPGATSMSGLPAAASASSLALPLKKKVKANKAATATAANAGAGAGAASVAAASGKPPQGPTGPSLPAKKAPKKQTSSSSNEPPVASAADMSDKELRARERQIRARRKHGPAIKLKPRSPMVAATEGTAARTNGASSSNQLSPSHGLAYDESDGDVCADEDDGPGDGEAVAGSLDDYAFATTAEEYRERPDALITEQGDDYSDADEDNDEDDEDLAHQRQRSREATHSAGSQRSAGSSRVRSKLHAYEDYEEKLQADYLALRRQFQAKLKAATEEYHGRHSSGDVDGDEVGAAPTATSPSSRFQRRADDGDGEDDSVLTRSVTDLYVAMGDGSAKASAAAAAGVDGDSVASVDATAAADAAAVAAAEEVERRLREQLQVTTKDLLRSWAMEDELEARREAAQRRAESGAEGNDDDDEARHIGGRPMAMDDEAAAEYAAWLRSRGELPSDDEADDDDDEDADEEFDPIQAHMAQRRREVAAARQEFRRTSAGAGGTTTTIPTTLGSAKSRGDRRSAATIDEEEDNDDDDEDEDDDSAVLFDEEKALLLAERRQRRRQQELAAMKQREAEKKQFWEALLNT